MKNAICTYFSIGQRAAKQRELLSQVISEMPDTDKVSASRLGRLDLLDLPDSRWITVSRLEINSMDSGEG
jgi:hypothetical protein